MFFETLSGRFLAPAAMAVSLRVFLPRGEAIFRHEIVLLTLYSVETKTHCVARFVIRKCVANIM